MSDMYPVRRGSENIQEIEDRMVAAIIRQGIVIGADIDGTLVHAVPGEHKNVPADPVLTQLFNNLNDVTGGNAFMLTGRPAEFVHNVFPNRRFLTGSEHGAEISPSSDIDFVARVGDPEKMKQFRAAFREAQANDSDLSKVQIEDYKQSTATLGFTGLINPEGTATIPPEMMERMTSLTKRVIDISSQILENIGAVGVNVLDTVTPTNAVVEILPNGACKAESLQYLRDNGDLDSVGLTVFSGDSGGDEAVMTKVFNEGGICLGVGPKAPDCSHIVFDKPENHRAFLSHVLDRSVTESPAVQSRLVAAL